MSGALVDLVATGVQDAYLTGQPEVSFFRQSYKRHTNFATKPVKIVPMGTIGANNEISLKIPNKGDLLSTIWVDLDDGRCESNLNSNSVNSTIFELWIGGQMVDRQDANFMVNHWAKFLVDSGAKADAFDNNDPGDNNWLPLHFFFCDGTPLPLVALQYHEVEIRITFGDGLGSIKPSFYAEYILLDTNERDYFVKTPHEILINQTQRLPATNGSDSSPAFDLSLLNHPVKSLHWSNVSSVSIQGDNDLWNTGNVMLWLNGTSVFDSPMPDKYFTTVQGYMHSEHASGLLNSLYAGNQGFPLKMYSFAQKVSKHHPTGSCNFSRLDNAELKCTDATDTPRSGLALYAVNWNVLRIKDGLSGVAFAN